MEKLETIKVTNPEGREFEIKVITTLKKPEDSSKRFLLYTFDDEAENIDIYASVLREEDGINILDSISEKEDWDLIQKAIEELSE